MPLGVFGGTFDPVHLGHLRLAQEALTKLGLAEVLWLPTGQPPHRAAPVIEPAHRLEMVRLAIAGNPGFALDDSEATSESVSYTIHSLERLRAQHGKARPLVLLLGADAFLGLTSWHRWRDLFELAHIGIATRSSQHVAPEQMEPALASEFRQRLRIVRPGDPVLDEAAAGFVAHFAMTSLDISATAIRATLAAHGNVSYLLPDAVLGYIDHNQLYS